MNVSPHLIYIWSLKQLHDFVDIYGHNYWWMGEVYEIKSKRIVPGRYKVWFVSQSPTG